MAVYGPTESVLEVVSVLRRHVPDDTYRFPTAVDFSGRNVYRSSLLRLENLERLHAETLRAGHMDGVLAFSKARALERLRAYDLAADHYRRAAERDPVLRDEALRSAGICAAIAAALEHGIDRVDPLSEGEAAPFEDLEPDEVVADLDDRVSLLLDATSPDDGSHYPTLVREEIERADSARAEYFVAMRFAEPNGNVRAVAEMQRLLSRHAHSHLGLRHTLSLANLYATLCEEYVAAVPPESMHFDPPRFRELVDATAQLYESVAAQDGAAEKLEAARRLEAFLAFTLQVDRDRFVQ